MSPPANPLWGSPARIRDDVTVPGGLRGLMLWQSLLPMAVGGVAGIAGAVLLGRYLQHLIAGAESTGVLACAVAAGTLAFAAALAVWTATGRIVKMDPAAALRAE